MAFPSNDIKNLVASGYPVIYLVSFDENYVEKAINSLGQQLLGEKFNFKGSTLMGGRSFTKQGSP